MLAQALPQLPDTADEFNAVARDLGVASADIHLGSDASETTLWQRRQRDYAETHAAFRLRDCLFRNPWSRRLLTASEVAQLKLNADWVVLSACNTIAGDKPGAEALSGLARSFFYAGARALLVTHWAVDSASATRLTTSTFDRRKADPNLGRAEALRQAMLAYLDDASFAAQCLPGLLGLVRPDRRGRRLLILVLCCVGRSRQSYCASQYDAWGITTRPFAARIYGPESRAGRQVFERDQAPALNKPNMTGSAWQAGRSTVIGRRTGA